MSELKQPSRRATTPRAGSKSKGSASSAAASEQLSAAPEAVDAQTLAAIFRRLRELNPEPKGELEHLNAYTLLVAVVLSAQSTDAGVNKATQRLFALADTPQKMLALGEEGLREHIKTLNFFNTKAKNIIALSRRLVEEFGGEVPAEVEVLETLPGVGRKSASVVANIAFGTPRIAVDTHIFRVANRIPLAVTKAPLETQDALEAIVPQEYLRDAHHWLILHGRYICKARQPECWRCPITEFCRYPDKAPAPRTA
jgi:endonuclease-3